MEQKRYDELQNIDVATEYMFNFHKGLIDRYNELSDEEQERLVAESTILDAYINMKSHVITALHGKKKEKQTYKIRKCNIRKAVISAYRKDSHS